MLGRCADATGQMVDSMLVEKQRVFMQTDFFTTAQTGWVGSTRVKGKGTMSDNSASIAAPSYTTPDGSGVSSTTFGPGQNYTEEMHFNTRRIRIPPIIRMPGTDSTYAAVYTNLTTFTIIAIPQPAIYAASAGIVALAGVFQVRGRQRDSRGV